MTVGERIKQLRKLRRLSADYVAQELGVSRSTIFRYENGDIEKVPAEIIDKLSGILGTTPGYLMGWADEKNTTITEAASNYLSSTPGYKELSKTIKDFLNIDEKITSKKHLKIRNAIAHMSKLDDENLEEVLKFAEYKLEQQEKEKPFYLNDIEVPVCMVVNDKINSPMFLVGATVENVSMAKFILQQADLEPRYNFGGELPLDKMNNETLIDKANEILSTEADFVEMLESAELKKSKI